MGLSRVTIAQTHGIKNMPWLPAVPDVEDDGALWLRAASSRGAWTGPAGSAISSDFSRTRFQRLRLCHFDEFARGADIAFYVGNRQGARTGHGLDAVTEALPVFAGRPDASGRHPRAALHAPLARRAGVDFQ